MRVIIFSVAALVLCTFFAWAWYFVYHTKLLWLANWEELAPSLRNALQLHCVAQ